MKIVFLLNTLTSGGAERVTASLANHWAAAGHEVTIITMGCDDDFYALRSEVQRERFDLAHDSAGPLNAMASAWRRITAIRRFLLQSKPDVAIAMMTSWNVELAIASRGLRLRVIGSERIHPPRLPLGRAWEFLRRHVYRWLDVTVVQTELTQRWVQQHTFARSVVVIPNPTPALVFRELPSTADLPEDAPLILGVGRLVMQKRFDRLVDAVATSSALGGWHLALVGEGPLETELKARAAEAGVAKRVHFPGRTREIGGWYGRADIFVLSSEFEGFPNALLEAMTAGLAVVATDCETGPADMVLDGINGRLVPNGDQEGLTAAITQFALDPVLRRKMGQAARVTAAKYSPDMIAAQWEALFPDHEGHS